MGCRRQGHGGRAQEVRRGATLALRELLKPQGRYGRMGIVAVPKKETPPPHPLPPYLPSRRTSPARGPLSLCPSSEGTTGSRSIVSNAKSTLPRQRTFLTPMLLGRFAKASLASIQTSGLNTACNSSPTCIRSGTTASPILSQFQVLRTSR